MLNTIINLPNDKKIAGVHCIPITENGTIVMAWDKEEQLLTTIGGRIEENESIIDRFGVGIVKEIINETNNTGDFERSFMQATHMTSTEFESNFLDAIKTY